MNQEIGKWLLIVGLLLIVAGLIVFFFGNKLSWIGHLPGDIRIERENFRFYFPITSMILFSIVLSLILRLIRSIL